MGVSALALTAVFPLAIAQAPELVVLPLATDGVSASAGLEAWKVITAQVERSRRKIKASTSLQKKQHDFLVGPAREQARDCGFKLDCLAEVGSTLGAQILVAGRVEKTAVVLFAIDIRDTSKIGDVRSSKKLARRSVKQKARGAAASLVRLLRTHAKKKPKIAAATPPKGTGSTDKVATPPPPDIIMDGDPTKTADTMGDAASDPISSASPTDGTILISKSQLGGVSAVTIDGESIGFAGNGSIQWTGAPGTHRLVATRVDGQSLNKDVRVNPSDVTQVTLEFAAVTAAATQVEPSEDDEPVTNKWWFWTSIGAAVAAGSATAIFLASGDKGGPSIPSSSGSIRGTY